MLRYPCERARAGPLLLCAHWGCARAAVDAIRPRSRKAWAPRAVPAQAAQAVLSSPQLVPKSTAFHACCWAAPSLPGLLYKVNLCRANKPSSSDCCQILITLIFTGSFTSCRYKIELRPKTGVVLSCALLRFAVRERTSVPAHGAARLRSLEFAGPW